MMPARSAAIAKSPERQFPGPAVGALDDALSHPERHERTVFLMSDDGYANTLTVAADILEELELPWTLFASTHHIDTGARNPMTLARIFFHYAPSGRYEIPNFASPIELADELQRADSRGADACGAKGDGCANLADQSVAAMMAAFSGRRARRVARALFVRKFPDMAGYCHARQTRRRDRRTCAYALAHAFAQSDEYLIEQARVPREKIIAAVGSCRYFAYPFGNVNDISPASVASGARRGL
jgi:peptidoglycan/xylan/chitin deacetylase (PgdA/CDA1 family)